MNEKKNQNKVKIERQVMIEQSPDIRRCNFKEVPFGYDENTAVTEASRCLECKNPSCVLGCPVEVDIPGFIALIKEKNFEGAIKKIWSKNALPAVCGRVCPQEIQCEGRCILGKKGEPVAIGNLERFVSDYARNLELSDIPIMTQSSDKKVAIVGSGPSGLTVASDLIAKGYDVTILEAFHKPGGVLVYGIPEFRLPKDIVFFEVALLQKQGVKLECNSVVGRTVSIDELFEQGFEAIYVGVGAGLPKFLNIDGENLIGILSANEYLTRANLMKAYLFPQVDTPMPKGKNVVVIGGGNVAMDAARTAIRLGAESVKIVYRRSRGEMPARKAEIHHAEEEGIEFFLLTNPISFTGNEKGRLITMRCLKMELGEPDESGRRKPIPMKDSEFEIECDLAIIAVGAGANPLLTQSDKEIRLNNWGYIMADSETGKTFKKGVWAGGDIVSGQATVILAMGAGRKAAESIDDYLKRGW